MDDKKLEELEARRKVARAMGSQAARDRLAAAGKLDARARLEFLLDPGTFREIGLLARSQHENLAEKTPADGLVAGWGEINGRKVYVTSEDASVLGGTRGRVAEAKTARVRELALRHKCPFVALMEAGAGRFQENNGAFAAGIGQRFGEHFLLSGQVPQVAAIMGACFGGPSFTAAQSDFVTIVNGSGFMGMSGPKVVKVGIGQDVTMDEIGGADISARQTGQANHLAENDESSLLAIRTFLSYLPSNCDELPPRVETVAAPCETEEGSRQIAELVPENGRRAYSMKRLLKLVCDGGEFFPYSENYGASLITCWARMQGRSVGIVANEPMKGAGAMDEKAAIKARKFVDVCNAFHIPVIFLTDCPGFIVGPNIEQHRMVSLAARLLNSVIGADVPKVTVVIRKAIGLAYLALGGKTMNPDVIVGWPTAQFDVMGTAAGVELVHGKKIAGADDPQALRQELIEAAERDAEGYRAAEAGLIDDIIRPEETRAVICDALERACAAQKAGFKQRIDP
ncbi:MAG: acyl-CoA carboxylase subunit beta [Nitratireductor sp.]|nr:acyl-CoA carboxylase subunit beta [Nitratireductor sp.]